MDNGQPNEKDIYSEFDRPLISGEKWYLVDFKWYKNWKSYVGIDSTPNKEQLPGPVDNSGLFEKKSKNLSDHLMEDIDYALVPEEPWNKLIEIYGLQDGQEPIERKVIESGAYSKQCSIEIYPPEIQLQQHQNLDSTVIKETFSRADIIENVHNRMREIFDVPDNQTTRVYIKDASDNLKESDTVDEAGVGPTQPLVLEHQNDDGTWPRTSPPSYEQTMSEKPSTTTTITTKKSIPSYNVNGYGTRSSSNSFYNSRSEQPGICGLSNLGNTCFMNSAIQCLSNVPSLTMYFLENKFEDELNYDNPLGMHGKLAKAYAALVHDIWSGQHSSVSPREFKYNVGSFAPRFSGYQQHDSQELIAFLIDGLHEDLNRIKQKPYIELKDSDGRQDSLVANEAWLNHRQRNDSIIIDTFHGLFKSTLVCPDCSRISITFDPFGFLSLPLPGMKDTNVICHFISRNPEKAVTKHSVSVPKNGIMKDVLAALAERTGCNATDLVIGDVYNYRFYKVYKGTEKVTGYSDRDNLFVYEVGDGEDNRNEPEYARVFMRQTGRMGSRLFAHPFLIPVKSGVTTYRKFYNSVLTAVSRYIKVEFKDDVRMLSELRKCEINESDVDGFDQEEEKHEETEDEETRLFKLVTINSFGTSILKELKDNNKPIAFSRDCYFAADWDAKLYEEYVEDDWTAMFHTDPSVSLGPRKEKGISLRDCMNLFTTEEKLGERDLWYCPGCKEHKQATKKFDLWSLPPVLIIHLKRFSYSRWSRDKIGTMVDFPVRDLDLSEFIINPDKDVWPKQKKMYNLMAVSNHYGGMGGGHYTAYARNYKDGKWYYFDDSSVTSSSEDQVQTKAAYMLMYQRQDMEEWVNSGGAEKFNFLESMVSPRGCSGAAGFTYDGATNENLATKNLHNGNGNLSEGNYYETTDMDTS